MKADISFNASISIEGETKTQSPTATLKGDFINALLGTSSDQLTMIDRIVLVDTSGAERDAVALTSTDWEVVSAQYMIKTSKIIQATGTYTFNKVRLKSGTKTYFEATVTDRSVTSGQSVTVSVTITMSMTWTVITQPAGCNIIASGSLLIINALMRLAGRGGNITLYRATWGVKPTPIVGQWTLTKSISEKRAYHPTYNFTQSGSLNSVYIENTAGEDVIVISLGTTVYVTPSDTCELNLVFNI